MKKDELLNALEEQREKFLEAIDGLSNEELIEPGVVGDWSVKDIIFHLSMWEADLIKLLWQLSQGEKPSTAYFTNSSVDETNAAWQEISKTRSLDQTLADFEAVRKQTYRRVSAIPDKDLIDPDRYEWLEGDPLWKWIAGDSFEHEIEHAAQIRMWRRNKLKENLRK
jgi:hypothetical protein